MFLQFSVCVLGFVTASDVNIRLFYSNIIDQKVTNVHRHQKFIFGYRQYIIQSYNTYKQHMYHAARMKLKTFISQFQERQVSTTTDS